MGPEADVISRGASADQSRLTYRRYWMALYRRDVARAEAIVEQCLKAWKPQHVYLRLFEPALNFSGTMWAKGCITYQDEHFVTYHTLRLLRRVRHRFVPAETYGPLAMRLPGLVQASPCCSIARRGTIRKNWWAISAGRKGTACRVRMRTV